MVCKQNDLTSTEIRALVTKVGGKVGVRRILAGELVVVEKSSIPIVPEIDWQKVYFELNLEKQFNLMDLASPKKKMFLESSYWSLPMVEGVTIKKVFDLFFENGFFVVEKTPHLDDQVTINARDPANGSYVVDFYRSIDTKEHMDETADLLTDQHISGITFLEYAVLDLGVFMTTGTPLDQKTATLCAGTRDSFGYVPCIFCNPASREIHVQAFYTYRAGSGIGHRIVREHN
jgi:hypothetical protein